MISVFSHSFTFALRRIIIILRNLEPKKKVQKKIDYFNILYVFKENVKLSLLSICGFNSENKLWLFWLRYDKSLVI